MAHKNRRTSNHPTLSAVKGHRFDSTDPDIKPVLDDDIAEYFHVQWGSRFDEDPEWMLIHNEANHARWVDYRRDNMPLDREIRRRIREQSSYDGDFVREYSIDPNLYQFWLKNA